MYQQRHFQTIVILTDVSFTRLFFVDLLLGVFYFWKRTSLAKSPNYFITKLAPNIFLIKIFFHSDVAEVDNRTFSSFHLLLLLLLLLFNLSIVFVLFGQVFDEILSKLFSAFKIVYTQGIWVWEEAY